MMVCIHLHRNMSDCKEGRDTIKARKSNERVKGGMEDW